MDIYKRKSWYWSIESVDSVVMISEVLNSDVTGVSLDGLNSFRKRVLKDYYEMLIMIYKACGFKTRILDVNTKYGKHRLYSGTTVFDIEEDMQIKLLNITNKLSELLFDDEIKNEHIIKIFQLAIDKVIE